MRKRLIIALFFFSSISFGQTRADYEIYSNVIDSFIFEKDSERYILENVVILEKFEPSEDYVAKYVETLYNTETEIDIQNRNWYLRYDTALINLIENEAVKECLFKLKKNINNTPTLENGKFSLKTTYTLITASRFNRFFKFNSKNGWTKFYKKFPNSSGIFSLSGVEYSENYACLYVENIDGGLAGTGGIVLLKQVNNVWTILTYLEIWIS